MRRNFCKGKPKKASIRRKRGPPHGEKDHHKKYPPAHGEKDSSLTRQHNLLTPSLPAPGRAPTHDHFRHARSIVNSKHNYMFFLFIYTTFIKRSIHKSICSNALLKTQ